MRSAVAVLVVAGVAGYKGWTYWQVKRAQDAGSQFSQALQDSTDTAKAHAILTDLAQSGPEGYRVLARFQLAAAEAKAGETDKAVADYDALAVDPGVDPILQGHASLQAAALRLEKADMAEMERRLKPLTDSGSPWQFSARELLGLTAYRLNDMREAEKAVQRAGRRSGNSAEFAGARRHDARADRGKASGAQHHVAIVREP